MPAPKGHEPYNKNGEGGRPKKYTDEFIEKEAEELEKWIKKPKSIWFGDFAFERGYDDNRMAEFAEMNERFSGALREARCWQKNLLTKGALTNKLNPGFTKFVMANTCGWTEKTESKISGDISNPLNFIINNVDGTSKDLVKE